MKILIDHPQPFRLAHGGFQVQIEQTKSALEKIGEQVEFLRWWDAAQTGDLIHFFGLPDGRWPNLLRQKKIKLVISPLLGGLGARAPWKRALQKTLIHAAHTALPEAALARLGWNIWTSADACLALTSWEAKLMNTVFQAPRARIHVIPNGVDEIFFETPAEPRGEWLVTIASTFPVKRVLETAQAAIRAQTPYWVIGQPLSETDTYHQAFLALSRQHPKIIRYQGAISDRRELARVYRQARGFVLLSQWESLSLSALEAAACKCPLLLSDLPWAHSAFGEHVSYCPIASPEKTAGVLKKFYDVAPTLPAPPKPSTWLDVAQQLRKVYETVLSTSW